MRLTTLAALAAFTFTACIQETEPYPPTDDNRSNENDNSVACAPAPSGAGYWEDSSWDGLHCNYEWTSSGEWAYHLNSSETGCIEESWAPSQSYGEVKLWVDERTGTRGCDWVIPWE